MRDSKSLLLLLLAAGLVITWIFHIYDKSRYATVHNREAAKDSVAIAEAIADSLRRFYLHTLEQLDKKKALKDSAGTTGESIIRNQLSELNNLRSEISGLLKNKNLSQADIAGINQKLKILQDKIESFEIKDTAFAYEKRVLSDIVTGLNAEVNLRRQKLQKENDKKTTEPKQPTEPPPFIVSEIKFAAYYRLPDNREVATTDQQQAEKLAASFTVKNNLYDFQNAEVIVVVTDPSEKTLSADLWDTGSFDTRLEGKKKYTRKLRFQYRKGEALQLNFSLGPDIFEKGIYKLFIYHNGVRIGTASCKLS
jgi:hypothetical protein